MTRARAGFTLIEVVVVLLIMAVAAAVTVPALLNAPVEDDLTRAARRVDTLFRLARDSASRSGATVTVAFDSASGNAWLFSSHTDSVSSMAATVRDRAGVTEEAPGGSIGLPSTVRVRLTKLRATFEFRPTGAAFGDSLVLAGPLGTRLITIDPWTGDAIIQ